MPGPQLSRLTGHALDMRRWFPSVFANHLAIAKMLLHNSVRSGLVQTAVPHALWIDHHHWTKVARKETTRLGYEHVLIQHSLFHQPSVQVFPNVA